MRHYTEHKIFLFLLIASTVRAQSAPTDSIAYKDSLFFRTTIISHPSPTIGLGASYGANFFHDDILPPSLSSGCDIFQSGKGNGINFSATVTIPINGTWSLSPTLSYENLSADHAWGEFGSASDTTGGIRSDHTVHFDHVISASTKALGLKFNADWQPLKALTVFGGPALFYLFDKKYTKTERSITNDLILTPAGPARELLESSGSLPNASTILVGLSLGIQTDLPLSKRLTASPKIEYLLPFGGTTSYWRGESIRGGITLRYQLEPRFDTLTDSYHEQIPIRIERPEIKKPPLRASIEAVDPNGNQQTIAQLDVEEVRVHYAYPMLNYIFFDEGSSEVPSRYKVYGSSTDAMKDFSPARTNQKSLIEMYHNSLNVLGERLKKNTNFNVVLTGTTSNTQSESGNLSLAKKRAERIKEYFTTIWQVDPKRIKIASRLLPEKASPSDIPQGQAENRRVEIISNEESLTDPLIVTRTEHIANPPRIFLQPHINASAGIASYRTSISIGGRELVSFNGAEQKMWSVPEEALSSGIDSLDMNLEVRDSAGSEVKVHSAIKLQQLHVEHERQHELEKFSLILFAFDESTLGTKNERTLNLVAESFRKKQAEKLSIIGYTDGLGEATHNDDLSRRRATEAATELENVLRTKGIAMPKNTLIDGKGSHEVLYDNSLPEGRLFSRTVNISVEHGR
ncbi:MAG: OmpA family protein [bacterium]